jgi:hypothetical protein
MDGKKKTKTVVFRFIFSRPSPTLEVVSDRTAVRLSGPTCLLQSDNVGQSDRSRTSRTEVGQSDVYMYCKASKQ